VPWALRGADACYAVTLAVRGWLRRFSCCTSCWHLIALTAYAMVAIITLAVWSLRRSCSCRASLWPRLASQLLYYTSFLPHGA